MDRRERFAHVMNHQMPDRVPIDIGGTSLTGMRPRCRKGLCRLLGFPEHTAAHQQDVDERILQWAGTDFRSVGGIVELPSVHTSAAAPDAQVDCWGVQRVRVDGEWQINHSPLRGATLAELRSFTWPEPRIGETDLAGWQARARELRENSPYVVVAEHPVYGILELGCWMCGYDDFFLKLATDPDFIRYFFDRVTAIQMAVIEQYYTALGPYIDLTTSGDDFGSQRGPLLSPEMFAAFVAPYFSARIKRTKELARCYYWHHTCGSVVRLLDQIIACGVDILNPIQTSAADMQPARLKERFGDRLVFWGGMDVQRFLPRAKPEAIADRVRELIATLGKNGGYVMAPAHIIQDDVPAVNILAWIEALHAHRRQPSK